MIFVIGAWIGKNSAVSALFEDRGGDLWIGTRNAGLFRFRAGSFVRVAVSYVEITDIMEDREGDLWVGTAGGGLNRLRPSQFHLRQTKHGLSHDNIASLCEDTEGRLWVVGRDGVPVRSLDETHQVFATPPGWPGGAVMTVCPDPSGGVLLGTINAGLLRWQNGVFSRVKLWEQITALLFDRRGDLWVSTIHGALIRRQEKENHYMPVDDGLVATRSLAVDRAGRLWVGTEDGLVFQRTDDRPFTRVLLPGAGEGDVVQFIVPDVEGSVWIGALQGGLYRWRAGRVTRMPVGSGLPLDDLRSLVIDPAGVFWVGTVHGLFRTTRAEIDAVMDGEKTVAKITAYGSNDGLPNAEFSLGFRGAGIRTRDGHLWFATTRGALEITGQAARVKAPLSPVLIDGFRAGGASVAIDGARRLTLPPMQGAIQILYTLPHLSAPDQIGFRYRLMGWGEADWVIAGDQRSATFTHLPPGDYQFEVSAAEAGGPWLPATASIGFTVSAAWWETAWFRAGLGVLGSLLLALVVRFFVRRRMRARMLRLEQETALERERTRIARDMHDQLGANLTQITVLGELVRLDPPAKAPGHINEMVSIARGTVSALDEIVWAVNPRYDTLFALLEYLGKFAVGFLSSAGIACEVDIPSDLPERSLSSSVRHDLFIVVKETLNNIAKHAGVCSVRLRVELAGGALRVVVTDDGRGFDVGSVPSDANGLRNLRERMAEAGGTYRIESRIGRGTLVTVELPFT